MAAPSVTNTFTNSTTADGTEVNQNFTDVINGISDGTKDLSISALTCAGNVAMNGNVTLGNATGDDITITGSLASTVNIKTDNTYDIGTSTIGLRALYFGANSKRVGIKASASTSATWNLTLPVSAGSARQVLETDGTGVGAWVPIRKSPTALSNIGYTSSVGSSALTVTINSADGTAFSATNAGIAAFDSVTSNVHDGASDQVSIASSIALTISSGSTLGFRSGLTHFAYVYLINNAGTAEVAMSGVMLDEGTVHTTIAEGGAGAADTIGTLYSASARTNVSIRLLGRITFSLTTAGTWDEAGDNLTLVPFEREVAAMEYSGNAGAALTADTTNITWNDIGTDTHAAWDGTTWIAPRSDYYAYHGSVNLTGAVNTFVSSYIDAASQKVESDQLNSTIHSFSGMRYLTAGQALTFRIDANATEADSGPVHNLSIHSVH